MTQINAYIGFNGKCLEAMEFYRACLGGELEIQTISESPISSHFPEEMLHQVLHSSLKKDALMIMGSDMVGPDGYTSGNNINLSLSCSSEEEVTRFFNSLSEGGRILDPLGVKFWGGTFGVLIDKFDIRWMLIYDENQQ